MPVAGQTPVRTHWEDSEAIVFEKIGAPYVDPNDPTKLVQDVKIHRSSEVDVNASTSVTINGKGGTVIVLEDGSPAAAISVSLDSSVADGFVCDVLNESTNDATLSPSSGDINDGSGAGSSATLAAGTSCRLSKTSSGSPATAHWRMLKGAGGAGGTGDVVGPASATNNDFVQFDGTTGKLIKDGGISLDADGTLAANSDSRIATQKAVKTYVDSAVGTVPGTTPWTASLVTRTSGTVYQNTSSHWMLVVANFGSTSGSSAAAATDSSNPPTTNVSAMNVPSGYTGFLAFFVKPGDYYKITITNLSFLGVREILITKGSITDSGNISGSRSLGTVYQNTSGSLMIVDVVFGNNGTNTVTSDSANPPTQIVWKQSATAAVSHCFALVMPGDYYKVATDVSTVTTWHEYVWDTVTVARSSQIAPYRGPTVKGGLPVSLVKNVGAGGLWVNVCGTNTATGTLFLFNEPAAGVSGYSLGTSITETAMSSLSAATRNVFGPIGASEFYSVMYDGGAMTTTSWFEWLIS